MVGGDERKEKKGEGGKSWLSDTAGKHFENHHKHFLQYCIQNSIVVTAHYLNPTERVISRLLDIPSIREVLRMSEQEWKSRTLAEM